MCSEVVLVSVRVESAIRAGQRLKGFEPLLEALKARAAFSEDRHDQDSHIVLELVVECPFLLVPGIVRDFLI